MDVFFFLTRGSSLRTNSITCKRHAQGAGLDRRVLIAELDELPTRPLVRVVDPRAAVLHVHALQSKETDTFNKQWYGRGTCRLVGKAARQTEQI